MRQGLGAPRAAALRRPTRLALCRLRRIVGAWPTADPSGPCRTPRRPPPTTPHRRAAGAPAKVAAVGEDKIREAIERDVAAAEADATPEPEPEPEPDTPEPEPQPAPPAGDAEAEKAWATAERASVNYGKKVAATLDAHETKLFECPLCLPNLRGYLHEDDAGRIPDDVKAVVLAFLGETQEAEYAPAPDVGECEPCHGLGKVRSGSKVPNYVTLTCAHCKGHGFYPPPGSPSNGAVPRDEPGMLALVGAPDPVRDDADAWGSPRLLPSGLENPNYGRMPQYKDPNLP